jgi:rubrerythrin
VIEGESAKVGCKYEDYCVGGRRPAGLISEGSGSGASPLARWLAKAAHLEAASVPAFERLAGELQEHGAPPELVAAATAAADDERRHAELVTELAVRAGGQPSPLAIAAAKARPLIALALENAVEGCVRETWAALLATHQGEAARDPEIRACMATIAADETRHAALAWAIDAWIRALLTPEERARVEHARRAAALALRDSPIPAADLIDRGGLPLPAAAEQLWRGLDAALWRSAA